jgi:hypothetical protein
MKKITDDGKPKYLPVRSSYKSLEDIEKEFTNRIATRIKYFSKKMNKGQGDFFEFDSEGIVFNTLPRQVINSIANNNVSYKKEFISEDKIKVIAQNLNLTTCELLYGTDEEIEEFVKFLYEKIAYNFLPFQGKNIKWNTNSRGYINEFFEVNFDLLSVLSYSGRFGFIIHYHQEIFNRMYPESTIKLDIPIVMNRGDIQLQIEFIVRYFWESSKKLFIDSFRKDFQVNIANIKKWKEKLIFWLNASVTEILDNYKKFFEDDEIYALGYKIKEETDKHIDTQVSHYINRNRLNRILWLRMAQNAEFMRVKRNTVIGTPKEFLEDFIDTSQKGLKIFQSSFFFNLMKKFENYIPEEHRNEYDLYNYLCEFSEKLSNTKQELLAGTEMFGYLMESLFESMKQVFIDYSEQIIFNYSQECNMVGYLIPSKIEEVTAHWRPNTNKTFYNFGDDEYDSASSYNVNEEYEKESIFMDSELLDAELKTIIQKIKIQDKALKRIGFEQPNIIIIE